MKKIQKVKAYLAKYGSEFPDEEPFAMLPLPTDAIASVSDPQNWVCFPENVIRIYLTT